MEKTPISALIITQNEQKHIAACLESLTWADEIILVDGGSTDRTLEIARDSKAPWFSLLRVYENPWPGFLVQRNFALEKATHDWVFVLDSDEVCSAELIEEIQKLSQGSLEAHPGYKVRRREFFLGKPIHHGIWNPSYQDRLFKKSGVSYQNWVHEYPIIDGEMGRIHQPILHHLYNNPEKFLYKMNHYTSLEAKQRVEEGQRTHWIHLIFGGPAMFFKNLFYYKAYKDGAHGVIISLLEGLSRTVRHIKIWQYTKERPQS